MTMFMMMFDWNIWQKYCVERRTEEMKPFPVEDNDMTYLFYMLNIMATDGITRASAAPILTWFSRNVCVFTSEDHGQQQQ